MTGGFSTRGPLPGLSDLRVLDLGRGLAGGMVAKLLAELGAQVLRPVGADGAFSGCPAGGFWHRQSETDADLEKTLAFADICIVGGEDFPGQPPLPDVVTLAAAHPRLIVVELGSGVNTAAGPLPAVDLLMQALSGAVFEQIGDRPVALSCPIAGHGCALQALLGIFLALIDRLQTGRGQIVTSSMIGGLAMFWAPFWMTAEKPDRYFHDITPVGARQLILRSFDNDMIQIVLGVTGAVGRLHEALGMPPPDDPADRGLPDPARGARNFFGDLDLFNRYAVLLEGGTLLARLRAVGIPAERIRPSSAIWDDDQVARLACLPTAADGTTGVGLPLRTRFHDPVDRPRQPAGELPLSGLKVVDLGKFVAGPYASKLLADYGADVTAVIAPDGTPTLSGGRTVMSVFAGKELVEIDAKTPDGRARLHDLCIGADMVLNNFRPGAAERLGVAPHQLRADNPAILTLATTAYGPIGPRATVPGFDMTLQAWSGLQRRNGGDQPLCLRTPVIDFTAGALGAIGLLAARYVQCTSRQPGDVETSLLEAALHLMSDVVRLPDGAIAGPPLQDPDRLGATPAEALYRTGDGWIAIAVRSPAMALAFANVLVLPLGDDPKRWGEAERSELAAAIRNWRTGALLAALEPAGVWAAPCVRDGWRSIDDDGRVFRTTDDPLLGNVRHCLGPLVSFSASKARIPAKVTVLERSGDAKR